MSKRYPVVSWEASSGDRYLGCPEVAAMIGEDLRCCVSCHYDDDDDISPLSEIDLPDGRIAMVCCVFAAALRKWLARDGSTEGCGHDSTTDE
jgi:hypothetical protein